MPARVAKTVSLPDFVLKSYNELWNVPDWEVDFSFVIDEVLYRHGTGCHGIHPAWNLMNKMKMSAVMGHTHSRAGTKWSMNPLKRFFCLDVGCGISEKEWQFAYGRDMLERPILACGIVDDGQPISVAMKCSHGEKYHDSRFEEPNETKSYKPKPKYMGRMITKRKEPIHFFVDGEFLACNSDLSIFAYENNRTIIKSKVTCGNCVKTKIFKETK